MVSVINTFQHPLLSQNTISVTFVFALLVGAMIPNIAGAQEVVNAGILDNISAAFASRLETLSAAVGGRAQQLLLLLLAVDMVLSVGRGLIAQESFAAMVQKLAMRVGFVTIVLLFIQNVAEFTKWLADVAVQLGSEASGENRDVSPKLSGMFKEGWSMALRMLDEISLWKPLSIFYVVCAFCVLLVTGVMLATFLTAYVELYVVALAGMIVLGFAGLETSKDSVATYVRTLIGLALKLMALLLVYFIMTKITIDVAGAESSALGLELVVTIVILQVVTVLLLMTVPSSVASLSGGVGASRAAEAVGAAVAAGVARPAAMAATGASLGAVTGAARGAASAQLGGGAAASAASFSKSVGKGALSGAGRAGSAGAFRNGKIRAELSKDIAAIFKKGGDA